MSSAPGDTSQPRGAVTALSYLVVVNDIPGITVESGDSHIRVVLAKFSNNRTVYPKQFPLIVAATETNQCMFFQRINLTLKQKRITFKTTPV